MAAFLVLLFVAIAGSVVYRTLTRGGEDNATSSGLRHVKGEIHGQMRLVALAILPCQRCILSVR